MSKGKKGSKTTPEAVGWDEGLLSAAVQEEDWRPYLVFVSPNSPYDEPHIRALASAVEAGTRRRFSVIDKTTLLQSAAEDVKLAQAATGGGGKKSKAAAAQPAQRPMFVEVCEQVVDAMKSSEPLPPLLLAKMIKYKVLKEKAAHRAAIAQKEAEEAAKTQAAKKGGEGKGGKGGRAGSKAAGKKGKDTPAVDADPAIPLPEKPPVSMMKRGEEDTDSKYIDDEPVDGPTCYFVMTGFSSIDLFQQLSPVGLTAHILMNISGGSAVPETQTTDEEEEEEQRRREREQKERDLTQFWGRLAACVEATRDGHMLRDMAQVELGVPQPLVPHEDSEEKDVYSQSLFDSMARSVYRVLEQREQYHHYLNYLQLRQLSLPHSEEGRGVSSPTTDLSSQSLPIQLSVGGEESPKTDMRLYNELLNSVPPESTTIPLMLHCMLEQLSVTLEPSLTHTAPDSTKANDVLSDITNFVSQLCIPTAEKKGLLPSSNQEASDLTSQRGMVTIEYWDKMGLQGCNLPDLKLVKSQNDTNNRACLWKILCPPQTDTDERNSHLAMLHAVQHHCTSSTVSEQLLNHTLLTLSLEQIALPSPTSPPDLSNPAVSPPLLFDFPLNIPLRKRRGPASGALVPYSGAESTGVGDVAQDDCELDLPTPHSSLAGFSVCELMSRDSLLQLLQSLNSTHPHLAVFTHKLSQSTVVVAHSGFDGRPLHRHSCLSLAHSRVGFNNYLQHVAEQCGREVDRAVEEDQERREEFEEERQQLIQAREKELQQQQQQSLEKQQKEEEEAETARASAKGGKKSSTSSAKKTPNGKRSKVDVTCTTPEPDKAPDTDAGLPEFEERKLYEAYDVGDRVLLNKGTVSVQFLHDGSQVHTNKTENLGSDNTIMVSALSNGHKVTCSMTRGELEADSVREESGGSGENENEQVDISPTEDEGQPKPTKAACIPQPPPGVKFSSITAQFRDSINVSLSHFGPSGNGELPFQPEKPAILLEPTSTDAASSSDSRPQSRQTPQKMSKKQMEQQQQMLEQQRQLEEQKQRERAEAQEDYDARCSALLRQNKYQQLFTSTPYGLHVHLQVDVDLNADPAATDGSDGRIIVRQSYPSQGSRQNVSILSLITRDEVERYYLPDGSVLCFMGDRSISVLCLDGHVYHTATESLTDLYQQQLSHTNSCDTQSGEEENQKNEENSTQPTFSDTKVTFADQMRRVQTEVPPERKKRLSELVWVVTTPSGQRYLWRCPTPSGAIEKKSQESEDSEAAVAGEAGAAPDGDSDTTTQQQEQQDQQSPRVVPLPPAQVHLATDPITKQVLISREDNVTLLEGPDGSFVAEHADGTRITTTPQPTSPSTLPEIMVECPGFARVTHTATQQCLVEFPDGSTVVGSTNGGYTVEKETEYRLEVESSGEARCQLQPAESSAYIFTLDHTAATGNILLAKAKKTKVEFSVDRDGVPSVSGSGAIPLHPAFSPRYFVVPSSGSPYQIVNKTELDLYISEMESQPDATVVRGEVVPGFEGETIAVMRNLREENPAMMSYKNGSIIPKNLSLAAPATNQKATANGRKRFGVGVGKSLQILPITTHTEVGVKKVDAPKALQCRQFVILDQFDDTSRGQVCEGLVRYISWKEQQQHRGDDLLPVDPRQLPEIRAAQDLKSQWLTKMTGNILSSALQDLTQQSSPPTTENQQADAKSSTRLLNGIRRELEEAECNRAALRNHTVPLYFESTKGQEFLRSQSPDMAALAKQLAQPRVQPQTRPPSDPSHSSTPSSLQSTYIILPPGGVDSPVLHPGGVDSPVLQPGGVEDPDVGDIDTASVSSTSKIRPTHPTPDHARGLRTPTDVRPQNPTPFGANRPTHSPAPSVVSQFNPPATASQKMGGAAGETADEQQAERSVSFMLPQRRPSLVGESSPGDPKDHQGAKQYNTLQVEDMTRRKVRTSSTMAGGTGVVRGLEARPQTLDFGTIQEGCLYGKTLVLKNVGIDPCRFRIKQPPPSTGIRVIYTPGPVAAGMTRKCEVELFAIAVGVVGRSGTGRVSHNLEVVSETNTLHIPVLATVLTASEDQQNCLAPAEGVRQIQRPSSSREDYTRPRPK